ncbi:uncharacterized protein MONBRDRAFT_34730 [Monosiga brevicollis MX1]|uniref:ABC transporter domain-containing protein n=1 Tax=Monosiga brevicollis TaxID=81824 RepID=A9VDL9_MONBE|nr:uncharacterized protein MONBRDRAFT_34730 [Monosiga brevicollis MX1]EDQ84385.1 predicted protein [Monosiga brevicollis MX1]|eukprot:XP_001750786.1 hypothetical protein [Monosiga brevicollis MX1]
MSRLSEEETLAALQELLPNFEDEGVLEYIVGMLMDFDPSETPDSIAECVSLSLFRARALALSFYRPALSISTLAQAEPYTVFMLSHCRPPCRFLDGYVDDDEIRPLVDRITARVLGQDTADGATPSASASAAHNDHDDEKRLLLAAPVIMAQSARDDEAKLAASQDLMTKTYINTNEAMQSWADEDDVADSVEAIEMRAKLKKKTEKREKKQLKRERVVAPRRTAMLEALTTRPVVIHTVIGEDGSYGGSPCVDLHLNDINIDLAGLTILEDAKVTLAYGRKYGLVGRNGVGKTTFLKHLAAKALDGIPWYLQVLHIEQEVPACDLSPLELVLECDEERATLLRERNWIEKALNDDPKATAPKEETPDIPVKPGVDLLDRLGEIYERLEEIDADKAPSKAATILSGLSFTQSMMRKPIKEFSGGWRMRVSLARALFIEPDMLLLDEPTNHLDLHAVLWLENYLQNYENTVVIVSHAKGFLNSVCTDILEMRDRQVHRFKGNFDSFEDQKSHKMVQDEKAREGLERKRSQLQSFINKNIGGGAKGASMAKSRQKMLEKMASLPDDVSTDPTVRFKIPNPGHVAGGFGIRLVGVGFHYPDAPMLFRNVEFSINQNSRICLVGPNGIGKSTLLKIVYQELEPTEGMVTRNQRLRVGRFSQHHVDELKDKKSALEKFRDLYPADPPNKIRKHLGSMGIQGDMQLRPINTLSGGQRSRVALALITYEEPHLLLLDEVTNHLDLDTVQALIHALMEYQGGVMIVSHDEHLITAVCDELWIIQDQKVVLSKGDFEDYKKGIVAQFNHGKKKRA